MVGMILKTAMAKKNDKNDIRCMIHSLGDIDSDFNSKEYRWGNVIEKGYDSNNDFLTEIVMDDNTFPTIKDKIAHYVNIWIRKDRYYKDCEYRIQESDNTIFVALAVTYES